MLRNTWTENAPLLSNATNFGEHTMNWNINEFGHIMKHKRILMARVDRVLEKSNIPHLIDLEIELKQELNIVLDQEESLWYQHAWTQWINDSDRKTNFYHQTTKAEQRSKYYRMMQLENGHCSEDTKAIRIGVVRFFENLLLKIQPLAFCSIQGVAL
ncbi:hypothetical protein V6N12_045590 [Hibiscus sabdariffa]|uniref:Uncharacterized protein n=1 Tax=Hibiscus sabdariffa TaxID=183260 RepID=A0ABR2G384_9ROSI